MVCVKFVVEVVVRGALWSPAGHCHDTLVEHKVERLLRLLLLGRFRVANERHDFRFHFPVNLFRNALQIVGRPYAVKFVKIRFNVFGK